MLALLSQLERQLKHQQLWQAEPPSPQALASTAPFAVDSLTPHQWLQWVLIPKFSAVIQAGHPLPSGFAIANYFEQVWQEQQQYQPIVAILRKIDQVGQ